MQIYNGREPYIFISYAHKDSATVLPIVEGLAAHGFRVWYDAGIEVGSEWPEYIAEHLCDSGCVIAFITEAALGSQNCRREINFAIDRRKQMLAVYLEEVELSVGMQMQLGTLQALFRDGYKDTAAFLEALCAAQLLAPCRNEAEQAPADFVPVYVFASDGAAEASYQEGLTQYNEYKRGSQLQTAAQSFRTAAEAGHVRAQYMLAMCYKHEYGGHWDTQPQTVDRATGKKLPKPVEVRRLVPNYASMLVWAQRAAEGGDADAQHLLAECYVYGHGVPKDSMKAAQWYLAAAQNGNVRAQGCIADRLLEGDGIVADAQAAVEWYHLAAENGLAYAQRRLAQCLEEGVGCARDYVQARDWYVRAAEENAGSGYRGADACLGAARCCAMLGDEAAAMLWCRTATERGEKSAFFALGALYYEQRRYDKAVACLNEAHKAYHPAAARLLAECFAYGHGVERDPLRARDLYKEAAGLGDAQASDWVAAHGSFFAWRKWLRELEDRA